VSYMNTDDKIHTFNNNGESQPTIDFLLARIAELEEINAKLKSMLAARIRMDELNSASDHNTLH
jgi:hypothetical protein